MSELPPCRGAINKKGFSWAFGSRRGLLAYVYSGVSLTMNDALVVGSGSYIVRLSVRDLHGPTVSMWFPGHHMVSAWKAHGVRI